MGNSVIEEVKNIFAKRKVLGYLNRTHIALIPKIHGTKTLGNYRPISLCNTMFVIKILVARLRPYLDKLFSPLQTTFVLGRRALIIQS